MCFYKFLLRVYDTSGPYTDRNYSVDIKDGIPARSMFCIIKGKKPGEIIFKS